MLILRFRDIPQFIQTGGYAVNVNLFHLERQINDFVEEGLQMNPDFQRGHVWTEQQQIAYVEYFLRGGRSGLDIYFNHPNWQSGGEAKEGEFVCVDGLQRITACLRFMRNEIPIFGKYLNEFEDEVTQRASFRFNINELQTREEVLTWYLEMNFAGTPHTKEELDRVTDLLLKEKGMTI